MPLVTVQYEGPHEAVVFQDTDRKQYLLPQGEEVELDSVVAGHLTGGHGSGKEGPIFTIG